MDNYIEKWSINYDKFKVMEDLQEAGVPSGAVLSMKELNLNPHLIERGYFDIIDHGPGVGKRPIPKQIPAKYNNVDSFVPKRAPRFGEDNDYVFNKLLGLSKDEISSLEQEGVVGGMPSFPPGKPTRLELIREQQAGTIDEDYLNEIRKKFGDEIGLVDE